MMKFVRNHENNWKVFYVLLALLGMAILFIGIFKLSFLWNILTFPFGLFLMIRSFRIGLKEFEWVEIFIHDYKNSLNEKTREDSFHFNLAKFYFETSNYKKAMPLLIQTKYDDPLHNLGAKSMLAKMYYELSEWDALEYLLESFKVYILRKKYWVSQGKLFNNDFLYQENYSH